MATQSRRVEDWRNRVVRLLDDLEDVYDIPVEYESLSGQAWLEANASVPDGTGLIDGHSDLTVGQVVAMIVSIGAIKTHIESNFHDDNLMKARS